MGTWNFPLLLAHRDDVRQLLFYDVLALGRARIGAFEAQKLILALPLTFARR